MVYNTNDLLEHWTAEKSVVPQCCGQVKNQAVTTAWEKRVPIHVLGGGSGVSIRLIPGELL